MAFESLFRSYAGIRIVCEFAAAIGKQPKLGSVLFRTLYGYADANGL